MKKLIELPKPKGDFILENAKGISLPNGQYYHYSEVVQLLTKYESLPMDWKYVENTKPFCYKTGNWDGKQSDLVLCQDKNGEYHLAHCYEGFLDGSKFFEWYDKNDFDLKVEIVKWTELN